MPEKIYSYLALGDSYTIGEMVSVKDNFPNQTVQLLQEGNITFHPPHITAKTGWTTSQLIDAIENENLRPHFDFVSLLIGVNNQYQGLSLPEYENQFEKLLKISVQLAKNHPAHVIVLSIPDWGVTPFAKGRNNNQIAGEIDVYNRINKNISQQYNVHYIDITAGTREAATDISLLADDHLHPSGKEYHRWANKITEVIIGQIK